MTIAQIYFGIDVSKAWLDVFDASSGKASRVVNAQADIAAFLAGLPAGAFVTFEATAPYDGELRRALDAAKIGSVRANPGRAREFARAKGKLAKTDAVDARMLAALPEALGLAPAPAYDAEREALVALHRRRDQLVDARAIERGRIADEPDNRAKTSLSRHIAWLTREIKLVEDEIEAALTSPAFAPKVALMRSIKGVGAVTAATLIALMPELGSVSGKAAASLAGLAPFNCDSGNMRGQRHIGGGRSRVRRALYMAALSAIRRVPRFKAQYQAIKARAKRSKIAIIAVARKILVVLNAMLKSGEPFRV